MPCAHWAWRRDVVCRYPTGAGDAPTMPAVANALLAPATRDISSFSGALLRVYPKGIGVGGDPAALMRGEAVGQVNPAVTAHLRACFDFAGYVADADFRDTLRTIFTKADKDVTVFVMLSNTKTVKFPSIAASMRAQNAPIMDVASAFPNVHPIDPLNFMSEQELRTLKTPHHYDRIVYYRIFQHIMSVMVPAPAP